MPPVPFKRAACGGRVLSRTVQDDFVNLPLMVRSSGRFPSTKVGSEPSSGAPGSEPTRAGLDYSWTRQLRRAFLRGRRLGQPCSPEKCYGSNPRGWRTPPLASGPLSFMTPRQKFVYLLGMLTAIALGSTVVTIGLTRLLPSVPYVSFVGPLLCVAAVLLFVSPGSDR